MAEDTDFVARDKAAYRRITAAARKLAVGTTATPLVEELSNANHQDADVRNMRRNEALANFLEALVDGGTAEASKPAKAEKTGKGTPAESAKGE